MAQVVFFSKGIVYDTDKQVVQLHQVGERFMLDASPCEKCVVTGIEFAQTVGYTYTLVGLKSKNTYTSRFIFRECDSANGFYADFECLTYMAAEQVETVVAQAAIVEETNRRGTGRKRPLLTSVCIAVLWLLNTRRRRWPSLPKSRPTCRSLNVSKPSATPV